jgi:DNA-binding transcriptional regulator YiaG
MTKIPYRIKHLFDDPDTRKGVAQYHATNIKQKAKEVAQSAKSVPQEQMNAFDEHCLKQAAEIAGETEVEELRRQIADLMRLAGQNYAISKQEFWRKYHARQEKRDEY